MISPSIRAQASEIVRTRVGRLRQNRVIAGSVVADRGGLDDDARWPRGFEHRGGYGAASRQATFANLSLSCVGPTAVGDSSAGQVDNGRVAVNRSTPSGSGRRVPDFGLHSDRQSRRPTEITGEHAYLVASDCQPGGERPTDQTSPTGNDN